MPRHGLWETLGESEQRRAREALKQVGAAALFDRPVTELSGGESGSASFLARSLLRVGRLTCLTSQRQNLILLKKNGSCIPFRDFPPERGLRRHGPFMICPLAARYGNQLVLLGKTGAIAAGRPAEVLAAGVLSRAYGVPLQVERSEGFIITEDKGNHPTKEEGIWE